MKELLWDLLEIYCVLLIVIWVTLLPAVVIAHFMGML